MVLDESTESRLSLQQAYIYDIYIYLHVYPWETSIVQSVAQKYLCM